ncbi:MAG TPA: hypothetical protein VFR41_04285, partial [Acidimicrobiia bacterium]|nr:hypothetical protein [Acidimicrobiia bacterium]
MRAGKLARAGSAVALMAGVAISVACAHGAGAITVTPVCTMTVDGSIAGTYTPTLQLQADAPNAVQPDTQ